jgi:hypothetical protein
MDEIQHNPEINPEANQPTTLQWVLIVVVGLVVILGIALFLSGGAFTAYTWYTGQQAKATETAAAATAIVMERNQVMIEASNWPLVIFDTFDDNENEWIDGEIDDEYSYIWVSINGVYRWEATAKQGFHWRVWPRSDFTTDFYLAVDAQNLSDNPEAQYGLIFRNNDDAYFYWEVSDTQDFRVFSYQNDWIELIPSTYTEAIRPGAENHLVVVSVDDEYKFWINDQYVGRASGSYPSKGQVGVAIGLSYEGEESTIIFDNFELRALTTEE